MRRHRAFSLVELLVVLGLIVLLVAGIGLTRREGDHGLALQSGEAQVLALLRGARASAMARQVPVRVLVAASGPSTSEVASENCLHCLQTANRAEGEGAVWVTDSPAICLPSGIFVVPPVVTADYLDAGATWPTGGAAPLSVLRGADILTVGSDGSGGTYYFVEFGADGRATPSAARVTIGTARQAPGQLPHFSSPITTRAVGVRAAGGIEPLTSTAGR
jgi:type II secretory pathway pseudopilin PulG